MRDGIEHRLGVGDIVADRSRQIFRIARLYDDGMAMAELEFTDGIGIACRAPLRQLSLATVQQVAACHVCVSAPSRREAAEMRYDGAMPKAVRASLWGRA